LTRKTHPRADDRSRPRAEASGMTIFDYLIGFAALAFVLWNMRRKELTDRQLLRPLIIAAVVCVEFLHGVPTTGAGGALVAAGVLLGVGCGALGALATRLERDGAGRVMAAPTPLAIGVTAAAFGGRMAFAIAATNGLGPAIGRFSASIGVHSAQAWVAALVLMAAADLATRAAILWQRRRQAVRLGCEMPAMTIATSST
jgi:hypothetical protein